MARAALTINSIIERQTTSVDPIGGDYVDAPQQTSYAGCPNSHHWKLGPPTSSGSLILIGGTAKPEAS
ncbi:MAG TPA: hypothetical protein VEW67_05640 [Thermoleophilaceae bacterium]|nr:hypothetical protein [Thermoleophilaceae bacterium]